MSHLESLLARIRAEARCSTHTTTVLSTAYENRPAIDLTGEPALRADSPWGASRRASSPRTMPDDARATAVAIHGETIVFVGDDEGARRCAPEGVRSTSAAGWSPRPSSTRTCTRCRPAR